MTQVQVHSCSTSITDTWEPQFLHLGNGWDIPPVQVWGLQVGAAFQATSPLVPATQALAGNKRPKSWSRNRQIFHMCT